MEKMLSKDIFTFFLSQKQKEKGIFEKLATKIEYEITCKKWRQFQNGFTADNGV